VPPSEGKLLLDTGALLAAERNDRRVWSLRKRALQRRLQWFIPVVVLAEAWPGRAQLNLSRFLSGCRIIPGSQALARAAGVARARAGMADVVDALVVVTALRLGAVVVTSEPDELGQIAAALGTSIATIAV
jgi:predicted nucleic acid-binding protein